MQDLADGFRVGDRFVPWSTTLEDAARLLGIPAGKAGRPIVAPCRMAYGLPALYATLGGPAADRPVLSVEYALADIGGLRGEDWIAAIGDRLGPPATFDRRPAPRGAPAEGSVVLHANWQAGDVGVGISIYGGPRQAGRARSVGALWLSWREEAAAAPFLAEWTERSASLAESAAALTDICTYGLAWPGTPAWGLSQGKADDAAARLARLSRLSLHAPELLDTPAVVAKRLTDSRFAIWQNARERLWCVSTPWETLAMRLGEKVPVDWIELLPAKGGGYSAIEIGDWRVRSAPGSAEIARAVRHIEGFAGVGVVRHEGYDC